MTDFNLFVTELASPDQARIVLPNAQCWGAPIINYTAFANRRVDLDFSLPAATPAAEAVDIALAAFKSEPRIQDAPEPVVVIKAIEFDKTILTAQGWAAAGEYVAVRQALMKKIKLALDAARARAASSSSAKQ